MASVAAADSAPSPRKALGETPWLGPVPAATLDRLAEQAILHRMPGGAHCLSKNLKLRSAEERVGCYLLRLVQKATPHVPMRLPLEKRRIAWQLGMTRETFSRTLAAMAPYGLRIIGDTVEGADAAALRARFHLDPLIDDPEPIVPLPPKRN